MLNTKKHPFDEIETTGLFPVLAWLESQQAHLPPLGYAHHADEQTVRINSKVSLGCETADVAKLTHDGQQWHLSQNVFSIFGTQGALPTHLTVLASRMQAKDNKCFSGFFDAIQERLVLAYYRAWANSRPLPQGKDLFGGFVDSFIGNRLGQHPSAPSQNMQRFFAGRLNQRVRSAEGLCAIVRNVFNVPVKIIENLPHTIRLRPDQISRLGGPLFRLKKTATVGKFAISYRKFAVELGPLTLDEYKRLLPRSSFLAELQKWVKLHVGVAAWELRLLLHKQEIPPATLGKIRLGHVAWVSSPQAEHATKVFQMSEKSLHRTKN